MSSGDIYLMANLLVSQHGEGARDYAKQKMWECRRNKDAEGMARWQALMDEMKRAKAG